MRLHNRVVLILLSAISLIGAPWAVKSYAQMFDPFECGEFYYRWFSDPFEALRLVDSGLLRIKINGELGTGFLIDEKRGYVLTAKHVVAAAIGTTTPPKITGAFKYEPDKWFVLTYDNEAQKDDVALLRFEPNDASKNVKRLDLSLELPPAGTQVAIAGFAFGDPKLTSDTGRASEILNRQFEVRANTFQGDSGGPVIDHWGLVVGVITDGRQRGIAVASPTVAFRSLLMDKIPPSQRAKESMSIIASGKFSKNFVDTFRPTHPDGATTANLDLVQLMTSLSQDDKIKLNDDFRKAVSCPVHRAAEDRQLSFAAAETIAPMIAKFSSPKDAAKSLLSSALILSKLGEATTASTRFDQAESAYFNAMLAYVDNKKPTLLDACPATRPTEVGTVFLRDLHIFQTDAPSTAQTDCKLPYQDQELADLIASYNSARLWRIANSMKPTPQIDVQAIEKSSAWGALMATDTTTYSRNIINIGGSSLVKNDRKTARAAFATSWQAGIRTEEVLKNYHAATPEHSGESYSESAASINSAKTLSSSDLKILAR